MSFSLASKKEKPWKYAIYFLTLFFSPPPPPPINPPLMQLQEYTVLFVITSGFQELNTILLSILSNIIP